MSAHISTNISVTPFTLFFFKPNGNIYYVHHLPPCLLCYNTHPGGLSILVCNKFLWLLSSLLYGYAVICLISPLLVGSWVILNFLLL